MAMAPSRNNDDVLARLMRAVVEDPAHALAVVATATCATVVRAAAALPVGGGRVCFLGLLLAACFLFGGVGAMLASVWVSADAHRRHITGQILLAVAVVNLLVGIGLSGFDPQIALKIIGAMV